MTRPLALVLLSVWIGHDWDSTLAALPDITELCPYSNFCMHKADRSLDDPALQSCCLPCSCHKDCGIIDKCCPDVTHAVHPAKVYPCRYQRGIYNHYLNVSNKAKDLGSSYRVIDGCPAESYEDPAMADSVSHCQHASQVEDLVFVTGNISGHTYLNKHCAFCNREYVYTEWTLYIIDTYIINGLLSTVTSFEERDQRILNNGGIMSVPPTQEVALGSVCLYYPEPIRECNVTKQWNFFDGDTERKCLEFSMEYFVDVWHFSTIYANVYCFVCNHPTGTPVPSECSRIQTGQADSKSDLSSFSALLTLKQVDELESVCKKMEVLDPLRKLCLPLVCPVGMFPISGSCIRLLDNVVGHSITLLMKITFHDNDTNILTSLDTTVLVHDIQRLVKKSVNKGNIRCGMCDTALLHNKQLENLYFETSSFSTHSCSGNDFLRGMSTLFKTSEIKAYLPKSQISVTLTLKDHETDLDRLNIDTLASMFTKMFCKLFTVPYKMETVYCPSIHLRKDDMQWFDGHGHVGNTILSRSVEIENRTLQICLDDYVSILEKANLISVAERIVVSKISLYTNILFSVLSFYFSP